jgi:hypothetical protein
MSFNRRNKVFTTTITKHSPKRHTTALQGAWQAKREQGHKGTQMAAKPKEQKEYKKIPLSPETYAKVAMISEANGFGLRGLGAQIEKWVERELPACEHKKQAVTIEYYPNGDDKLAAAIGMIRTGWYCPICTRVYAKAEA